MANHFKHDSWKPELNIATFAAIDVVLVQIHKTLALLPSNLRERRLPGFEDEGGLGGSAWSVSVSFSSHIVYTTIEDSISKIFQDDFQMPHMYDVEVRNVELTTCSWGPCVHLQLKGSQLPLVRGVAVELCNLRAGAAYNGLSGVFGPDAPDLPKASHRIQVEHENFPPRIIWNP